MTTAPAHLSLEVELRQCLRTWVLTALVLYVANGLAFAAFSTAGGFWFTVSDVFGLLLAVVLTMVVVRFDELFRPPMGALSRHARWVGVGAMVISVAGSLVLISSQVGHEFVPGGGGLGMQFAGWGLLSVWFILIGLMGQRTGMFSRRWGLAAYWSGGGSIASMLATIPLGPAHPVANAGFGVAFVAMILWVIWTRKELADQQ